MNIKFIAIAVLLFLATAGFVVAAEEAGSPEGYSSGVEGSASIDSGSEPSGYQSGVEGDESSEGDDAPGGYQSGVEGDTPAAPADEDDDDNGSRSSRSGQKKSSSRPSGEVLGAATGSCPLITSYMRMGQANDVEQVKALQEFLNKELGISLPVTGYFGELTTKAVIDFQLKYKDDVLKPWVEADLLDSEEEATGFVYITTAHMINSIACDDFDEELPALVPASN